ncbi:JAB domain-containing protein [Dyadobacter chenhuakuii]|uniref:JAB domain-containing protein n=1 Tax=Dyadobacter chenhuakuii TaxID=2909339 RepID=UPI0035B6AA6B
MFKILLLNNASRVLGIFEVSKSAISGESADVRIVFVAALKAKRTVIMLACNKFPVRINLVMPINRLRRIPTDTCLHNSR